MHPEDRPAPFARLNAALDALPRTRFEPLGRQRPAFRSLGFAGLYLALGAILGLGPLAGRDPLALAGAAAAAVLSFFVYALGRKLVTGHERLVLMEHAWVALAAAAGVLWALGVPVRPHLDVVAAGLAFGLAVGRCGCLLVGCCHGRPAAVGITYTAGCVRDGFPRHLVGVRLFPVPALESLGLAAIGAVATAALLLGAPGAALACFLIGYAVLRFALEGLRGDRRPHLGGLSQGRWMAMGQLAAGLLLADGRPLAVVAAAPSTAAVGGGLAALLLAALVRHALRPEFIGARHVRALRALVRELAAQIHAAPNLPGTRPEPTTGRTGAGVVVAVSLAPREAPPGRLYVSLSQLRGGRDLEQLCQLATTAFPGLDLATAHASDQLLGFLTPPPESDEVAPALEWGRQLYGAVLSSAGERPADESPQPAPRARYFGANPLPLRSTPRAGSPER